MNKPILPSADFPTYICEKDLGRTAENFSRTEKFLTPTETICAELQCAYTYFNRALFNDELPECMLTIDYSGRCILGYFRPYSFVSNSGILVDQISMNPAFLLKDDLVWVLSTLVHEMCHLWVFRCTSRKKVTGYHCKVWGAKMESIGLIPSHTGKPGGRKTGYQMLDYPLQDGLFDFACRALLESKFSITWGMAMLDMGGAATPGTSPVEPHSKNRSKGKVKFVCPTCNKPAWAAPSRNLVCGDDLARMEKMEKEA